MRWLLALVLSLPGVAFAHNGGITFGLQYGLGSWSFDQSHLSDQVSYPLASDFLAHTHGGQALDLHLGYNILGYGGLEADATATGWNITTADRGGGGFVGGLASFSPFNFFLPHDRPWDAQVCLGYAYGLVGQTEAMDGGVFQWALRGEYFVTPNVSIGGALRFFHPGFSEFILDYNNRDQPGNTLPLPQGSGGLFWMFGVQLGVLIPVGPQQSAGPAPAADAPAETPAPAPKPAARPATKSSTKPAPKSTTQDTPPSGEPD
ncbi:MAG: hypothetical protein JST54_32950 [Deltaproteobacteria bacterium]|nr:hypothetical protein [Deltaproteobacteria bacterium]